MPNEQFRQDCSRFLGFLGESLDIAPSLHDKAKERYEALGRWLDREGGPLAQYHPEIYPQGSFRLGTVIKPINDKDDYDIDLVCTLTRSKTGLTQSQLKRDVGKDLITYCSANGMKSMPEDKRRCWRMDYADGVSFHMDILPATPDDHIFVQSLIRAGVPAALAKHALAITDKEHANYRSPIDDWPRTNPKGYAGWFINRMKVRRDALKRQLVTMKKYGKVDDVPDFEVKTPLQRSVQLLKRHRDIMFAEDPEDKPISIIISTLAAHAYNNEADLLDSLIGIISSMEQHIHIVNGEAWIANPVNPLEENFADKWPGTEKAQKFKEWLSQVKADLAQALETNDRDGFIDAVGPVFGGDMIKSVRARIEKSQPRVASLVKRASTALARFNVAWRRKPDWSMRSDTRFALRAYLSRHDGFRPFAYRYRSGGESLPKGVTIRFAVDVPRNSNDEFYWQVTNTGDEARWAGDLRGGFHVDDRSHEECTKYTGDHCVQCFVVRNGVCIAQSEEFVVRIR